jgi:hypothetical protein
MRPARRAIGDGNGVAGRDGTGIARRQFLQASGWCGRTLGALTRPSLGEGESANMAATVLRKSVCPATGG